MRTTPRKKMNRMQRTETLNAYLFIAPLVIGTSVFAIAPIFYSFYLSLLDWDGLGAKTFVGLYNFAQALTEPKLLRSLTNTLTYMLGVVPAGLILSLFLANALNKRIVGKTAFRIIYYLPNVTMTAAIAVVWRWIFNSQYGLFNQMLGAFGLPQPIWTGDPRFIMPAIIIVSVWGGLGYNMMFFLSGLKNIPETFFEAARLDGAKEGYIFWRITFPLLTPTTFFLLTMSVMSALKVFDIIFMFAAGGQMVSNNIVAASRSLVYNIFENAFTNMKMGLAASQAVILFALIMLITLIQFVCQKRWVYYD